MEQHQKKAWSKPSVRKIELTDEVLNLFEARAQSGCFAGSRETRAKRVAR